LAPTARPGKARPRRVRVVGPGRIEGEGGGAGEGASRRLTLEQPVDRDYGSREFVCRDPEGNVWCFGTYWPKVQESPPAGGG
jgi:hypothetical protein